MYASECRLLYNSMSTTELKNELIKLSWCIFDDEIEYHQKYIEELLNFRNKKITEQDKKDIHLKYAINNILSRYDSYWRYRENKKCEIVEEIFKEIKQGKL